MHPSIYCMHPSLQFVIHAHSISPSYPPPPLGHSHTHIHPYVLTHTPTFIPCSAEGTPSEGYFHIWQAGPVPHTDSRTKPEEVQRAQRWVLNMLRLFLYRKPSGCCTISNTHVYCAMCCGIIPIRRRPCPNQRLLQSSADPPEPPCHPSRAHLPLLLPKIHVHRCRGRLCTGRGAQSQH
jgi:hypothetical protein